MISIEEASKRINVPVDIIERGVLNGFAIPIENKKPYYFLEEEISKWKNDDDLGEVIESRLKRKDNNEYIGKFIEPGEYKTKNKYVLPFKECWLVSDGGRERTPEGKMRSAHFYGAPCIRWAWDFMIINSDDYHKCHIGMSIKQLLNLRGRRGQKENSPDYDISEPWEKPFRKKVLNQDALNPKDHFLHGIDIISPADGVVISRRDGSQKDPIFEAQVEEAKKKNDNRQISFMIDHGNNEVSQFAHVIARTVAIKPGRKVKQGEFICKAGGGHMTPHLHWAVWDNWHPLLAQGLPITISECMVYEKGEFITKKEIWLERGMLVKNR